MISKAEKYDLNRPTIERFIRAFYKVLWNKKDGLSAKLNLVHLAGKHKEGAFIDLRSDDGCLNAGKASIVKPRSGEK